MGLVDVGMFGSAVEVGGDVVGEGEGCVFHGVVVEEVVQLGAVVFGVGVEGFYGMGVDTDGGGIGEQEFYAGGVYVVMGGDRGDGFVHDLFLLV